MKKRGTPATESSRALGSDLRRSVLAARQKIIPQNSLVKIESVGGNIFITNALIPIAVLGGMKAFLQFISDLDGPSLEKTRASTCRILVDQKDDNLLEETREELEA